MIYFNLNKPTGGFGMTKEIARQKAKELVAKMTVEEKRTIGFGKKGFIAFVCE